MVQVYGIVGSKHFQTAVLFNVNILIAKANLGQEQISLYTRQNAITCIINISSLDTLCTKDLTNQVLDNDYLRPTML